VKPSSDANGRPHPASSSAIGYLERGEYSPSLYLALRIAEHFEVPVEVIFSTTPFPRIGSSERSV
jgi:DNA-binding XRE family transcriptional regulator